MTEPLQSDRPPFDAKTRAATLDATDPLRAHRSAFLDHPEVVSYLDGNSLGRPLAVTPGRLAAFVEQQWGGRLIRGWDESWMEAPTRLGDTIGRVTLAAAAGQTVVADSTTVLLYKLIRAAVTARPGRREIVADTENFPTDRFVLEGVAAECDVTLRWITPDRSLGVTPDLVRAAVGEQTALVVVSQIAYKSGFIADMAAITAAAHEVGSLILWDLCHSVGSIDVQLDANDVDLAVGCTYKYLNGGPGAPAFAYVAKRLHEDFRQPIQGWMGAADPFGMTETYVPSPTIRQVISGTPPIVGMQPMMDMLELIEEAGILAIRQKSILLTQFVLDYVDEVLTPLGVRVISPREDAVRGSHVTIEHPRFRELTAELWERGVIPDFRPPSGLRIGLSPLSTSFDEVRVGLDVVADLLAQ